jgi:hypothetical protein
MRQDTKNKMERRQAILVALGWDGLETYESSWVQWIGLLKWLHSAMTFEAMGELLGLGKDTLRNDMVEGGLETIHRGVRSTGRPKKPIEYDGELYPGGIQELADAYDLTYGNTVRRMETGIDLDWKRGTPK